MVVCSRLTFGGALVCACLMPLGAGSTERARARPGDIVVISATRAHEAQGAATTGTGLKIVVIEGEDAVNIVQQKTAVAPVIEVRDRNDQPVAGAVVTFTVRGGRATFGGARTLTMTTNAAGRAVATGLTPAASGAVQIGASAAFEGQVAAATIVQTNVLTAAQAANAAAAGAGGGAGGGGLSTPVIAGIAGAVGAAALTATAVTGGEPAPTAANQAPTIASVSASPSLGLQAATTVAFAVQASDPNNDALSYRWDFGDGGTSTDAAPTHVFNVAGTFAVRATVSDASSSATSQTTVTIKGVTGRWQGTMTCPPARCSILVQFPITIDATQIGSTVSGTSRQQVPGLPADTCTFSTGSVQDRAGAERRVSFTQFQGCGLVNLNYGGCFGSLDTSLDRMLPDATGQSLTCDLVRQ